MHEDAFRTFEVDLQNFCHGVTSSQFLTPLGFAYVPPPSSMTLLPNPNFGGEGALVKRSYAHSALSPLSSPSKTRSSKRAQEVSPSPKAAKTGEQRRLRRRASW